MRLTIHQPEHAPWLGFFHKLVRADTFVVLDNVQFRKNYFQNRNKIKVSDGWRWITVPVRFSINTLIKDVEIAEDRRWKKKWLDSVHFSYRKSKYFEQYFEDISCLIKRDYGKLIDLNLSLIKSLCGFLLINNNFVLASDLGIETKSSKMILDICRKMKATSYLSGISGKEYLHLREFEKENITVIFQEFHHPVYEQLYGAFEPCMSILDLLFNHGAKSIDIINGMGVPVMEELFT